MSIEREPLETLAILTDRVEMKARSASFTFRFDIRGEDDPLAIGEIERRKIRGAVRGDRSLAASIRIHHENFKLPRLHQPLFEQVLILVDLRLIGGMRRPVDDAFAVRREERSAVVADLVRQPPGLRAIEIHGIEIQVSVFHGRPDDRLTVRRHSRFRIVARRGGQPLHLLPINAYGIEIVVVQSPAVGPTPLRLRRTVRPRRMGRRIEHAAIAREKVSACRSAHAGAHQSNGVTVQVHHVHLITTQPGVGRFKRGRVGIFHPIVRGLENQFVPAERKVGFGILPAHRQLANIFQMPLSLVRGNHPSLRGKALCLSRLLTQQQTDESDHAPLTEWDCWHRDAPPYDRSRVATRHE